MRIQSFTVTGFANFLRPISLSSLDDINVIYGANNAGKTNLLRAIELYFRLLGAGEVVTRSQFQTLEDPDPALAALLKTAFHRTEPQPIILTVEWNLAKGDLERHGLFADYPANRIITQLELHRVNRQIELRVTKFMINADDAANMDRTKDSAFIQFAQQVRRLLADAAPFQFDQPVMPCVRLGTTAELFPQELRDRLFDARQSIQPELRKRWGVFNRLASTLEVELGSGSWDTAFDRESGHADLVYTRGDDTIPVDAMGAGMQRVAALLAELALTPARWVCIDEPEWKLHPELQKRFVTLARRALESGVGPIQLFITTHSQPLANVCSPFLLQVEEDVARLDRRPWTTGRGAEFGDPADMIGGSELNLGDLIGLVDELSEIEPDELVAGLGANGFTETPAMSAAGA